MGYVEPLWQSLFNSTRYIEKQNNIFQEDIMHNEISALPHGHLSLKYKLKTKYFYFHIFLVTQTMDCI